MNGIKIHTVLFCEGIRAEIGGKYTLLGASAPDVTILGSAIPVTIFVSLFIVGTPEQSGPFHAELRVKNPDNSQVATAVLEGDFTQANISAIGVGQLPILISKEGNYIFEWKFGGKKWTKIETLIVRTRQEPLASILKASV